jgi:hypothetical protein
VGIGTTNPLANLHVVGNVFASGVEISGAFTSNNINTTFYFDTLVIPYISASQANISVSNSTSVVTSNIIATGGQGVTAIQANIHFEQSNVFIGNSAVVGSVSSFPTTVNSLNFDNSYQSAPTSPNKIILYSNTASGAVAGFSVGSASFGVLGTAPALIYHARTSHLFGTGLPATNYVMVIGSGSQVGIGTLQTSAKLHIGLTNPSTVQLRIDATTVALATTGGGLVGINTLTPTANLHVVGNVYASTDVISSNSIQTSNIIATGNVVIGHGVTAIQANIHFEQSNVFIGNSAIVGSTVNTTLQPSILKFDNSVGSVATFPNKILLYSNTTTPATNDYVGLGVWTTSAGNQTRGLSLYGRAGLNFYTGGGAVNSFTILSSGFVGVGVQNPTCTLQVNGTTVALATTGGGTVGFGTTQPTANLQVVGNVFASNALTAPSLFASSNITVGGGSVGSNIAVFSNGTNITVINSNAWVGIGTTNPTSSLQVNGNASFATDTFTVPFATVGTMGVLSGLTIGSSSTVLGSNLMVISNTSGGSNVTIFTGNAIGINTTLPTQALHVVGNTYISGLITNGTVYSSSGVLTNTNPSDVNLKTNIQNIPSGISILSNLTPISFDWIDSGQSSYGFIAQEISNVIPSISSCDPHGNLGYDPVSLIPFLARSIQELSAVPMLIGYTGSNGPYALQINGQIFATSSTVATSDAKFKSNVEDFTDATAIIMGLRPRTFEWLDHGTHNFPKGQQVGFIAQEVQEVLKNSPHLDAFVKKNSLNGEDFLGLAEGHLIPVLVAALKESNEKLEVAQNDIDLLETRLSDLEAIVRTLIPQKETTQTGPRSAALINQM